jgi:hypothetical protein
VAFFRRPEITTSKKIPEFEHFRLDRGRRIAMIQWNDKQLAAAGLDRWRLKALVRHRPDRERIQIASRGPTCRIATPRY